MTSMIDGLRASIGTANREILSQIWKYRLSTGEWIPIRLLHQRLGGKPVVRPQLEFLGGSIIFETDEASTDKKYGLTFLGILLTSEGDHLETLMAKYLKYAHAKAIAEPLRIEVSSKEVETDLQFTPTETAELGVMLHLSSFFSSGGFGPTEWNVRLPDDIEDLPQDILAYIRDIALRDYDPQVPLASSDRSSYFWGRQKLEAIKKATPIYNLKNIRTLLTEGFTAEELRRFCHDEPDFRPVYNKLAQDTGKATIIDWLLEYANQKLQIETLLTWAKKHNPAMYEKNQPYQDITISTTISNFTQEKSQRASFGQDKGAKIMKGLLKRITGKINIELFLVFAFGVVCLLIFLVLPIALPNPTPFQEVVFRVILSLAAAGIGAVIPGLINVELSLGKRFGGIRAVGALAVFVVVYFVNPARVIIELTPPAKCLALEGGIPFIKISEPLQTPACIDPTTPACTFKIIGTAGGVQSFNGCRIHTFVYPVIPKGIGWYIQQPPVSTTSGSWTQTAILGAEGFPAKTGDALSIQAALVRSDATLKGTRLSALELNTALQDLDDIEGIVALSEPIFLTVQR